MRMETESSSQTGISIQLGFTASEGEGLPGKSYARPAKVMPEKELPYIQLALYVECGTTNYVELRTIV